MISFKMSHNNQKINCRYSFNAIENKWFNKELNKEIKFKKHQDYKYVLEMLPYPSGEIHVGHVRNYQIGDMMRRYYYLKGYEVFRPMGWDAFGLPAENAAISNNIPPKEWTEKNISSMKQTLEKLGYLYNWENEIATCHPNYYGHQQKLFIEMYKLGVVSRKKDWINWDPVAKTVLANEQVDENGYSWRSGAKVEKKQIEQWFLNISKYSQELLDDLQKLNWPEKVLLMQKNWIGKSEGYIINFTYKGENLPVFTTTPEVIFGCNFLTISPHSKYAMEINPDITKQYLNTQEDKRENLQIGTCINQFTKKEIPIYLADYVLNDYGTGIVMGVGAYDERDGNFCNKNNIEKIILYDEDEKMINSEFLNGLNKQEAREEIAKKLEKKTFFRLRDWCLSRQRYWGCPIPVVYCDDCGMVLEENLPVKLPEKIDMSVNGNPLDSCEEFVNTTCPKCCKKTKRETDTMDTFVDSSWYFLRYQCSDNQNKAIDERATEVDLYIGGVEHAILHLLYARFFTKVLNELGYVKFREPFKRLITQGMVCHVSYKGKDSKQFYFPTDVMKDEDTGKLMANGEEVIVGPSTKMSKSEKNVVNPKDIVRSFGADALKMFIVSDSPIYKDFDWQSDALFGCHRFLQAVWRITCQIQDLADDQNDKIDDKLKQTVDVYLYNIDRFLDSLSFNLYIAEIRKFFDFIKNSLDKYNKGSIMFALKKFIVALWIVSPGLSYEIYEHMFGGILPEVCEWDSGCAPTELEVVTIVVQINGIKKDLFETREKDENKLLEIAKKRNNINNYKKYVYIPNKIINFVI